MASRIYVVSARADSRVLRYVRANNLNAAVRAYAHETVEAGVASAEDIWAASKGGELDVLDAIEAPTEGDR